MPSSPIRAASRTRPRRPPPSPRFSSLLGFLHVLPAPAHIVEELRLLRRRPVTGGDIFDLQILATMTVNGIERIYTFNAHDFASFPEFAVLAP